MKKIVLPVLAVLVLFLVVACASKSHNVPTKPAPQATASVATEHIGNYNVDIQNKLALAASYGQIPYRIGEPNGEGCTIPTDCNWSSGDKAFYIEPGKAEALWDAWLYLYCNPDSPYKPTNPDEVKKFCDLGND